MKILINLLLICNFVWLQAHTVWIETKVLGKPNQKHEVKMFFGEIDSPTPTEKWFSDIKDLELVIISPSGKKEIIKEKTQKQLYYSSYFIPVEKGVYKIQVNHLVRDLHRKMKITYQSAAFVNTDNSKQMLNLGEQPLEIETLSQWTKLNGKQILKLKKYGEYKVKEKLKIVADNGWETSLKSNDQGEVVFTPLWKGKYLLELVDSSKEQGIHNGQTYETDYKMLTLFLEF